jgi:hypothetical protein
MVRPPLPFTAISWSPDLAEALAEASAAIARLDARIAVSFVAPAWKLRARWTGYASALRLQQIPLEEIDIIAAHCSIVLAGRKPPEMAWVPEHEFDNWQNTLVEAPGRHWREDLPFTFDPPHGWKEAPALARALTLLDAWARSDRTSAPWLAFPVTLRRLGITQTALPCLVAGDAAQRFALEARPAMFKRLLKQLRRLAEDGLDRLDHLEAFRLRCAAAIAGEHRPGKLDELVRVCLTHPCLGARSLAPMLGLTISGAGKLLERARRLGLLVETSGRGSWRSYIAADVALALGLRAPERGRPRSQPQPTRAVGDILRDFDAEMAAIDARLGRPRSAPAPTVSDHDIDL